MNAPTVRSQPKCKHPKQGRKLSFEELFCAAFLRYAEKRSWESIAAHLECDRKTLQRWRKTPEWSRAMAEAVAEMRAQAEPEAWGTLVKAAHEGSVAAAKELLKRTDDAAPSCPSSYADRYAELEQLSDEELDRLEANLILSSQSRS